MSYTLPHPQRTLAIPLATLALGIAGGVSGALILSDDTVEFRSPAPAAEIALPSTATPVPERITSAPSVSPSSASSSAAPVPERITSAPSVSPSAASSSAAPVPERITSAPSVSPSAASSSAAPVPERLTNAPTSSLSGTTSDAPSPERISGARAR